MRVLILSAGKSIHTAKWVNAMIKRGHEVYLVYNKGHEPTNHLIDEKAVLKCLKYQGTVGYYLNAKELRKYVNEVQPDVINVHYASGYGTLARVARLKPYILSIWGSDVYEFPYDGKIKKRILEKNVLYAKELASTSECMADQLRKVMQDENLKITITPFGVDLNRFDGEKTSTSIKENVTIGIIKSLEEVYRISDFILAINELLKQNADNIINVEIYGDGSQKDDLVQLTKELGLEKIIKFRGRIPNSDVPKVLQNFDIFCVTSQKESFGVAVVEAMAMGKPVVATDAEGFKEVMVHENTGLIVEAGNIQAIAEALKRLVDNSELQKEYGNNGRQRVEQLYDWEKNVDIMENLYKEMVKR